MNFFFQYKKPADIAVAFENSMISECICYWIVEIMIDECWIHKARVDATDDEPVEIVIEITVEDERSGDGWRKCDD